MSERVCMYCGTSDGTLRQWESEVFHDTCRPLPAERNEPVPVGYDSWRDYEADVADALPRDEPVTVAGREALADPYLAAAPGSPFYAKFRDAILAIEREAAAPSVERLGLSDEQTRNLREHLTARQQTLGEWIGDVMFDSGLGRPDGIDYPPAARLSPPTDSGGER